jgi:hypothetical protein
LGILGKQAIGHFRKTSYWAFCGEKLLDILGKQAIGHFKKKSYWLFLENKLLGISGKKAIGHFWKTSYWAFCAEKLGCITQLLACLAEDWTEEELGFIGEEPDSI